MTDPTQMQEYPQPKAVIERTFNRTGFNPMSAIGHCHGCGVIVIFNGSFIPPQYSQIPPH